MPEHETTIILATIIAAVSAIAAVTGAVIASRSAGAAMKSAYLATMTAQKKYSGMLPPPITLTVNRKIDWARNFVGAINTPFGTVLIILFFIVVGVGLNPLLSGSDPPSAVAPASKPAALATTASISAPPLPTSTASAPASTASV
jgi:hypothetical protein